MRNSMSVQGISVKPSYILPRTKQQTESVRTFFSKEPKKNIIEVEAERKKHAPAPNKYQRPQSWSKINLGDNQQRFL